MIKTKAINCNWRRWGSPGGKKFNWDFWGGFFLCVQMGGGNRFIAFWAFREERKKKQTNMFAHTPEQVVLLNRVWTGKRWRSGSHSPSEQGWNCPYGINTDLYKTRGKLSLSGSHFFIFPFDTPLFNIIELIEAFKSNSVWNLFE